MEYSILESNDLKTISKKKLDEINISLETKYPISEFKTDEKRYKKLINENKCSRLNEITAQEFQAFLQGKSDIKLSIVNEFCAFLQIKKVYSTYEEKILRKIKKYCSNINSDNSKAKKESIVYIDNYEYFQQVYLKAYHSAFSWNTTEIIGRKGVGKRTIEGMIKHFAGPPQKGIKGKSVKCIEQEKSENIKEVTSDIIYIEPPLTYILPADPTDLLPYQEKEFNNFINNLVDHGMQKNERWGDLKKYINKLNIRIVLKQLKLNMTNNLMTQYNHSPQFFNITINRLTIQKENDVTNIIDKITDAVKKKGADHVNVNLNEIISDGNNKSIQKDCSPEELEQKNDTANCKGVLKDDKVQKIGTEHREDEKKMSINFKERTINNQKMKIMNRGWSFLEELFRKDSVIINDNNKEIRSKVKKILIKNNLRTLDYDIIVKRSEKLYLIENKKKYDIIFSDNLIKGITPIKTLFDDFFKDIKDGRKDEKTIVHHFTVIRQNDDFHKLLVPFLGHVIKVSRISKKDFVDVYNTNMNKDKDENEHAFELFTEKIFFELKSDQNSINKIEKYGVGKHRDTKKSKHQYFFSFIILPIAKKILMRDFNDTDNKIALFLESVSEDADFSSADFLEKLLENGKNTLI